MKKFKKLFVLMLSVVLMSAFSVAAITAFAAEERTDVKATNLYASLGNGKGIGFDYSKTGNATAIENWNEVKGYILYNGTAIDVNGQFDVHIMSGDFYIYLNAGKVFSAGDTIELKSGLHFPDLSGGDYYGVPTPALENQKYCDYLGENYKIKYTSAGAWVEVAASGSSNTLNSITAVTEIEEGSTMPETYEFEIKFNLEISETEISLLENNDAYSTMILINGKTVKQINSETIAKNKDDETISAIAISSYGNGIKLSIVKNTNIINLTENFSISISKDFVANTFVLAEDISRYYIQNLTYWSTIAPYELAKTTEVNVSSISDFEVIDGGANGCFNITFSDAIASSQLLAYNGHPYWLATLPAPYQSTIDIAADLASSGATESLINNILINDKSIAEYWADIASYEAKSNLYQIHILGGNILSIRSTVTNNFNSTNDIKVTLKSGLTFFNGAYLDHDVTINYAGSTTTDTSYTVKAESISVTSDKTIIGIGETATLTATINPVYTTDTVAYSSSDSSILTVDESGIVTAVKVGTATVKATINGIDSNIISITVNSPATSLTVENDTVTVLIGETSKINATVNPTDTTDTISYSSTDESIATVSSDGTITAIKEGTTTITVTCGTKTATVNVTVNKPVSETKSGCNSVVLNNNILMLMLVLLTAVTVIIISKKTKTSK